MQVQGMDLVRPWLKFLQRLRAAMPEQQRNRRLRCLGRWYVHGAANKHQHQLRWFCGHFRVRAKHHAHINVCWRATLLYFGCIQKAPCRENCGAAGFGVQLQKKVALSRGDGRHACAPCPCTFSRKSFTPSISGCSAARLQPVCQVCKSTAVHPQLFTAGKAQPWWAWCTTLRGFAYTGVFAHDRQRVPGILRLSNPPGPSTTGSLASASC